MAFDPGKGDLAWDPKKKAAKDAIRDANAARDRAGVIYAAFKTQLCSKARSRREVIHALESFKKALLDERDYLQDVGKFPVDKTIEGFIDPKLAMLTTIQLTAVNRITAHVPVTEAVSGAKAKSAKFRTRKEFDEIPWLKHFTQQHGFRGFYSKMSMEKFDIKYFIIAQYENDAAVVGTLENDVAWDDFPSLDDLQNPPEATS